MTFSHHFAADSLSLPAMILPCVDAVANTVSAVWRTDKGVSHAREYIILSLEVGRWAGEIAKARLPDSCTFDYVCVYKKPTARTRPAKAKPTTRPTTQPFSTSAAKYTPVTPVTSRRYRHVADRRCAYARNPAPYRILR